METGQGYASCVIKKRGLSRSACKRIGSSLVLIVMALQLCSSKAANDENALAHVSNNDCMAPCAKVAIVFIHGLTGSRTTWVNPTTRESFPKLLADDPTLREEVDVYSFQYDSFWMSGRPIVELKQLLAAQMDELVRSKHFSKVVFVAHSLGGNIAVEYLLHLPARYGHAALSRFPLLISLGTPFNGASLASLANLVSGNRQIRSLIELPNNDFLQLLKDTRAEVLQKQLDNRCSRLEFDAVFETKPMGPALIVSRESATAGATRTAGDGFGKNHVELPRPANRQDKVYEWVSKEIGLCAEGNIRCMAAQQPNPVCTVGDFWR